MEDSNDVCLIFEDEDDLEIKFKILLLGMLAFGGSQELQCLLSLL